MPADNDTVAVAGSAAITVGILLSALRAITALRAMTVPVWKAAMAINAILPIYDCLGLLAAGFGNKNNREPSPSD